MQACRLSMGKEIRSVLHLIIVNSILIIAIIGIVEIDCTGSAEYAA